MMTAFYTSRMLFVVFHGESNSAADQLHRQPHAPHSSSEGGLLQLPKLMTLTLIPLALLGLLGGVFNLPAYLTEHGLLSGFLGTVPGFAATGHASHSTEIILQIIAATACFLGLGLAWSRYTGERRADSLATESGEAPFHIRFLQSGWMLDDLFRLIFIRPFVWLAGFFWKKVDETTIDGTLDGLARFTVRLGELPAAWSSGRVATSLIALAGGVAAVLGFVAWEVLVR
jgi:NADH-quinone oxidoreductase subunit L